MSNETETMSPEQAEALRTELTQIDNSLAEAKEKYNSFCATRRERVKEIRELLKSAGKPAKPRKTREPGAVSEIGQQVLEFLAREEGVSKAELEAALPDSKPAYLSALVGRVLPERGYKIEGRTVEGQRGKRYYLIGRPTSAE